MVVMSETTMAVAVTMVAMITSLLQGGAHNGRQGADTSTDRCEIEENAVRAFNCRGWIERRRRGCWMVERVGSVDGGRK